MPHWRACSFARASLPLITNRTPGFKYIGNTALTLEKEGYEVPFGYEEAIGFMFGSLLRDKDGVAASVSHLSHASPSH